MESAALAMAFDDLIIGFILLVRFVSCLWWVPSPFGCFPLASWSRFRSLWLKLFRFKPVQLLTLASVKGTEEPKGVFVQAG